MNPEEFQDILYRKDETTGIVRVTLNQPKRKNSLTFHSFMELCLAADEVQKDPGATAMIITGAKDPDGNNPTREAFSSGGYFNPREEALGGGDAELNADDPYRIDRTDIAQKRLTLTMWKLDKPVIAAINGFAIGAGFTMPLACADLIFASEHAWAQLPFVPLGIVPEFASSYILPRLAGFQKAKELIYFGRKITAGELEAMGLINAVLPHEELLPYAQKQALKLVPPKGAGLAVRMAKRALHAPLIDAMANALDQENLALNKAMTTTDFFEALSARVERRSPVYTGK